MPKVPALKKARAADMPHPASRSARSASTKVGRKKGAKKATLGAALGELQLAADDATDTYLLAATTRVSYSAAVDRARAWLSSSVELSRKNPGIVILDEHGQPITDLNELEEAFDKPPNRHSAQALRLLLVDKCVQNDLSRSTCITYYSALKKYWEHM